MSFDGVAKTSLFVAAMRAVETERSDSEGRLFSDPFARTLAGAEGFSLLEQALAEVGDQPAIAIRTRYIDDRVSQALKEGIRQIVILAAGMDSRSYRMSFPTGTRIFELDRPEVLRYKQEKLNTVQPTCERYALGLDLREDWQSHLTQSGMDPKQRTLWLVEGLLMYLDESAVSGLFEKINALSVSDSVVVCDILGSTLLAAPHMKKQLELLASWGAPWRFGTDEPVKFMEKFGWKAVATQAGDVAPDRWPFPTAPLHIPNVPRGFYIEARKV
jgi:methyltransferase (TIGR00027 family)